jgi:hypothetical protein
VIIAGLISLRYVNPDSGSQFLTWARRGLVAAILALPALTWSGLMEHYHVSSRFFRAVPGEPPLERLGPTLSATAHYLHVLPVALLVLFLGGVLLRSSRSRAGLAHPIWLWTVAVTNLLALVGTYVFGAFEIHWWLSSSANRTTIFTQLILYTDIAIWAAVAVLPRPIPADGKPSSAPEATGRHVVGSVASR